MTTPIKQQKIKKSLFRDLWERRVAQFLGIYLGASWGILEFVSSLLVDRFGFSQYLISTSFIILFSFIPSILMIAYFHGKPGPDQWHKIEKIGIPINIVIIVSLVFWSLGSSKLDASTHSIRVLDETGKTIEKYIPKKEYKKRIALFFFNNENSDSAYSAYSYGIPDLISYDLSPDMYLNVKNSYFYGESFSRAGYSRVMGAPLSLLRDIARNDGMTYFLTGNYKFVNGLFQIQTRLYESESFQMIHSHDYEDASIYTLIDDISRQIKQDLQLYKIRDYKPQEMPVSEILSDNSDALLLFLESQYNRIVELNLPLALDKLNRALELDPNFIYVQVRLSLLYFMGNQMEKCYGILPKLMDNLYKLPEQDRYLIKYYYYLLQNQSENAMSILKMWIELYPEDIRPHIRLIRNHYLNEGQYDLAIEEYKKVFKIDPLQKNILLRIGKISCENRDYESAEKYINKYISYYPDNIKGYLALGNCYKESGEFEQAKELYSKVLVMEANDPKAFISLAEIDIKHAEFKEAEQYLAKALHFSKTQRDSIESLQMLSYMYYFQADFINALRYRILADNIEKSIATPLSILIKKLEDIEMFLFMDEVQIAKDITTELRKLSPPFDDLNLMGCLDIYSHQEDIPKLEISIASLKNSNLKSLLKKRLDGYIKLYEGRLNTLKQNDTKALEAYIDAYALLPDMLVDLTIPLANCYSRMGEYDSAKSYLNTMLILVPAHPELHYELAKIDWELGNQTDAINHISIALEIWKNAHPNYKPAKEAEGLLRRWQILM